MYHRARGVGFVRGRDALRKSRDPGRWPPYSRRPPPTVWEVDPEAAAFHELGGEGQRRGAPAGASLLVDVCSVVLLAVVAEAAIRTVAVAQGSLAGEHRPVTDERRVRGARGCPNKTLRVRNCTPRRRVPRPLVDALDGRVLRGAAEKHSRWRRGRRSSIVTPIPSDLPIKAFSGDVRGFHHTAPGRGVAQRRITTRRVQTIGTTS